MIYLFTSNRRSIRNISAADFAYQSIKEKILTADLKPEEPIVEEGLAEQLDISRTPLREALQRLEMEELVVRKLNGRLKVAPISVQEVEELFTIRSLLEGVVVSQAAKSSTENHLRHLNRIMNMFEMAIESDDIDEVLYLGGQFHSYIYEMSGNKTAIKILYQLNDHIHRYRRFVPKNISNQQNSLIEHKEIIKCIKEQNSLKAKQAMESHIMNSLDMVIAALENRKKDDEYAE